MSKVVFICRNCGLDWRPYKARGLCNVCYVYERRTGAPRPVLLDEPRRCRNCQTPTPFHTGRRCGACRAYYYRTGGERPEDLWRRARCTACRGYLPVGHPTFQTVCWQCSRRQEWSA